MPRHYKSKSAYEKAMAHIHIANIPHEQHKYVYIAGKKYYPKHKKESSGF